MGELDIPVYTQHNLGSFSHNAIQETGALILVDKPAGWTSFDVVAKTRNALRVKKVGHTGTLDPMATGLLVLCLGKATRLADQIQEGEKEYTGTMRFGGTTPSDDAETEVNEHFPIDHLNPEMIRACAAGFIGETMQTPPMYSARKVGGKRLYTLARKGETIERPAKSITVTVFNLPRIEFPDVDFRIICSRGTYIRTLARDLGGAVSSGAYLTALRRTRSGTYNVSDAVTMDDIARLREHLTKQEQENA